MKPITPDFLLRDARLVAVNKPAGLVSVPAAGEPGSALRAVARALELPAKGEADPRVRALHRLDKDTSGALMFALDREAQQFISHQFQNNSVRKTYLAIVIASPPDSGEIEEPLERDPSDPIRMRISRRGKRAKTMFRVVQRYRFCSLLEVTPLTGKTHQIRVHLRHIGHPLVVDPLYGHVGVEPRPRDRTPREPGLYLSSFKRGYNAPAGGEEKPLIGRLTLHAKSLALTHPSGEPVEIEAPLPRDFRAAVNMLSKYSLR